MFWVMMAGILPARYSEASARWPRPGFAAAKVASIAKRRRHASSRASRLKTNSSNGIGRLRVHNPPGERKSGIPLSVEMPAPVKGTMMEAAAIMSPSCSTPLLRSEAIMRDHPIVGCADYSTANRMSASPLPGSARGRTYAGRPLRAAISSGGFVQGCDSNGRFRNLGALLPALLGLRRRWRRGRFLRRFAELRQPFHFGFEFNLPCCDFFHQLGVHVLAQVHEIIDAHRVQINLCHLVPLISKLVIHRSTLFFHREAGTAHKFFYVCP